MSDVQVITRYCAHCKTEYVAPDQSAAPFCSGECAARAWHASEEGQAWHSAHSRRIWDNPTYTAVTCENCGRQFEAPVMAGARFCHANCSRQHRDAQHLNEVEVPCPACGTLFWQSKYRPRPATCSRKCGATLRRAPETADVDLAQAAQPSQAALRRGQRLQQRRQATSDRR